MTGSTELSPAMLHIIRSFHEDMHVEVRLGNTATVSFEVRNGLTQRCTVAPKLFNIFFSAVVPDRQSCCPQAGVTVRFFMVKTGCRPHWKTRLNTTQITDSQFADDTAVYATIHVVFKQATTELVQTTSRWGLTLNIWMTKGRLLAGDVRPLQLEDDDEVGMLRKLCHK